MQIDVMKCHLDGRMYLRKSVERRFVMRVREQCSLQLERDILLLARRTASPPGAAPHRRLPYLYASESGDALRRRRVTWAPQVVGVWGWVHAQGFVHRDIKPHNFVLTPDAHLLLIDFGSAAPLVGPERRVPKRNCLVPCGTCDYNAPEILQAHEQALVELEMEFSADDRDAAESDDDRRCGAGSREGRREAREDEYGYGSEVDWWSAGVMLY
ncbi:kinase-like domain-containing protein [Mycena olivaceomarginata]|nr:kinase-like domain-containing protein [Mycena olivaceomarginata]